MLNPNDKILWLDLETTGLDVVNNDILEVGLVVTRALEEELDHISLPINYGDAHHEVIGSLPAELKTMHATSGLIEACYFGHDPADACDVVHAWLDSWFGQGNNGILVGGSGIDRFDLPFLHQNRWFSSIPKRFHFRTYDTSAIKALLKANELPVPAQPAGVHRAVADARWSFEVAQQAVGLWQTGHEAGFRRMEVLPA